MSEPAAGDDGDVDRCTECGEPIGREWIYTEGKAHPECAEEKYAK